MSGERRAALVVCPGRGVYNKPELGYLRRHHRARAEIVDAADAYRRKIAMAPISELDARPVYELETFTRGANAAALIYTCSVADFAAIDRNRFDIVAVTGNSMGWYTALACAGAIGADDAHHVVNTMGRLTDAAPGGQMLHIFVDEEWRDRKGRAAFLEEIVDRVANQEGCELSVSIRLGGMVVVAGDEAGLAAFAAQAPGGPQPYPMRLHHHGAFHSPLMQDIARQAREELPSSLLRAPNVPMIDGGGRIWRKFATDCERLWDYTFGAQVTTPYDFSRAISLAVREFAPECVIILGPGATLGGAVAQSLIAVAWRGLDSKQAFVSLQETDPYVLSMGRDDQRAMVTQPEAMEMAP